MLDVSTLDCSGDIDINQGGHGVGHQGDHHLVHHFHFALPANDVEMSGDNSRNEGFENPFRRARNSLIRLREPAWGSP